MLDIVVVGETDGGVVMGVAKGGVEAVVLRVVQQWLVETTLHRETGDFGVSVVWD